jgi:hypothetical protein
MQEEQTKPSRRAQNAMCGTKADALAKAEEFDG